MQAQCFADSPNAEDESVRRMALNEIRRHLVNERFPECIAETRVDRLSAVHRKLARFRRNQEQHAVGVGMFVQTGATKVGAGVLERIGHVLA